MKEDEVLALVEQIEDDHTVYASSDEVILRWNKLRSLALNAAAAEERGRRRGVEEAIGIADKYDSGAAHLIAEQLRAALAPRDSAPARYCDAAHPSEPLKCGRFVQHDGAHTAFTPGFDSENRRAVHWVAPRDSGKEG